MTEAAAGTQTTPSSGGAPQTQGQAGGSSGGSTSTASAQTTQPTRPDWVPESAWKNGALDAEAYGKYFGEQVAPKLTAWAAESVRRTTLPQKPEDVVVAPPKDWKPPEGIEFKLDASNPAYNSLRELAVKHGMSNEAVSDLVGVYGGLVVGDQKQIREAAGAELQKLGPTAPQRIDAVNTFLTAMLGPAEARQMGNMLVTAGIVNAFEKLISKWSTQGSAGFSTVRDPAARGGSTISEEQYNAMSPAARLDYARKQDQSQFRRAS